MRACGEERDGSRLRCRDLHSCRHVHVPDTVVVTSSIRGSATVGGLAALLLADRGGSLASGPSSSAVERSWPQCALSPPCHAPPGRSPFASRARSVPSSPPGNGAERPGLEGDAGVTNSVTSTVRSPHERHRLSVGAALGGEAATRERLHQVGLGLDIGKWSRRGKHARDPRHPVAPGHTAAASSSTVETPMPYRSCRCAPCPARWLRSPRTRARAQDTAGAQAAASWTASSIVTSSWPPRAGDGRTSR